MFKKVSWIIVLVMLLSVSSLACSVLGGGGSEATAVPVPTEAPAAAVESPTQPSAAAEPAAAPTSEPAAAPTTASADTAAPPPPAAALNIENINGAPFDSYRFAMNMTFSGTDANGAAVTEEVNADYIISSDPPGKNVVMNITSSDPTAEDIGQITMTQIGDTAYMVIPGMGGCITSSGQDLMQDNPFADMLDPNGFLDNLDNAQYQGEETINDIRTLHYTFDATALTVATTEGVEDAEGNLYIAKDGGYMVRLVMDVRGVKDLLATGSNDTGDMHMEYNLSDVNEPVELAPPPECEGQANGDTGYPMPDDAYEVSSLSGLVSYKTALTADEVTTFYEDALTADGWMKDEDSSFAGGGSALLSFTRGSETLSVTINPDEASGDTAVMLMSDDGG